MPRCEECKSDFSKPSNLRAHVRRKHPEKLDLLAPKMRTQSGLGSHVCIKCSKCFINIGNLNRHFKTHLGELNEVAQAPNKKKIYSCNQCGVKFQAIKLLKKHKLCHVGVVLKSIKCSLCNYIGVSTGNVMLHYQNDHHLNIEVKKLEFEAIDAFQSWKSRIESETYRRWKAERA